MTHLLIPQIISLTTPIIKEMGIDIVNVFFQTNKRPSILRFDISNPTKNISLKDCEEVSRSLESILDETAIIPYAYILEVSSPGISQTLNTKRDFLTFQGFDISITTDPPYLNKKEWRGKLQKRDSEIIYLNCKGRIVSIPRFLVVQVQLAD
ncbi:ribosome maturation factor RimP [Candidatus Atelocyanobacterium thalassae]|uniref:Ribosome maturation factor RimP n=2 Tax=Candidatus Atelocyanobacterium thalassae TaxID=713887 RepID=A0A086CH29_9CHRO|nr:ribosome maturation factor RimP [Candidatus Atelocyanobacterium thalassa]KFF41493.1 MAG: hypothetical protein ucyna2_00689 [Candidatus Atelocyanobacterium thalassa isolate SIO64986]BDA40135.1 ribosome maturation factor RimP [cyanobacterium endosymbiont of Braarudosphaera bigelowii]